MISKLPRWVWTGAWALAFVAGFINVIGLLGFQHQSVSHLTGTTSLLATSVAQLNTAAMLRAGLVLAFFLAGTVLSGFIIQDTALQLGRRYGVALFLESLMICGAVPLLQQSRPLGVHLLACACGLQNAMVTTFSGTVVRTTHVSGMYTDLGISLGHALRGLTVDTRRLRMCLIVISAFLSGGIVGTLLFAHFEYAALLLPGSLIAATALLYVAVTAK